MKKIILAIITTSILLIACNKTDLQKATNSIKNTDSLFLEAKENYQAIDAVSKLIKDSGDVSLKDLNQHKDAIENAIKKRNINLDSLSKEFKEIKYKTQNNEDIAKAIDSVTSAIKNGDVSALKNIEETVNKVIKNTKTQTPKHNSPEDAYTPKEVKKNAYNYDSQPIKKSANIEIEVEDLGVSKAILEQSIDRNNGTITSNQQEETEGIAHQYITVKVPLSSFNNLVDRTASLGQITSKSLAEEGNDYLADQMCEVKITLTDKTPNQNNAEENLNLVNENQNKEETFGEKSSNAFMKGFSGLGALLITLIPFWPIFLIGGIVWYFIAKRNKKKREEEFQRQLALEKEKFKNAENIKTEPSENVQNEENNEQSNSEMPKKDDDFSKYMPKK